MKPKECQVWAKVKNFEFCSFCRRGFVIDRLTLLFGSLSTGAGLTPASVPPSSSRKNLLINNFSSVAESKFWHRMRSFSTNRLLHERLKTWNVAASICDDILPDWKWFFYLGVANHCTPRKFWIYLKSYIQLIDLVGVESRGYSLGFLQSAQIDRSPLCFWELISIIRRWSN